MILIIFNFQKFNDFQEFTKILQIRVIDGDNWILSFTSADTVLK